MKIVLVKADSNEFLNVTDATNAMERLMTQDKVDFVVGGFRTEAVCPCRILPWTIKRSSLAAGLHEIKLCHVLPKIIAVINTSSGVPRSITVIWSAPVSPIWPQVEQPLRKN